MNIKDEFDKEFTTDAEVDEALDNLIMGIANRAEEEDSKPTAVNSIKVQQVLFTYKVLKYLTKDMNEVKVSYKLHAPFKSMGSVSVTGTDIVIENPRWLSEVMKAASNIEIYPKTDGTLQMNFTFHGLTQTILETE